MNERIGFCSCLLFLTLHSSFLLGQSYLENFEKATIGDTVLSVGITGCFGNYLIDSNGVAESNAFEVPIASETSVFQNGFLPVQFGVNNIGERLTFRVDAQVTLTGGQVPAPRSLFDLFLFGNQGDFLLGQFAVEDDDNLFTTRIFTTGTNVDNVNQTNDDFAPLAKIGIEHGLLGESTFFKLQIDIFKLDFGDYVFSTSVFDLDGHLLSRGTVAGIDIEAIFENLVFISIVTNKVSFFESARFDNICYMVSPVIPGDVNVDGQVDLLDIAPFVDLTVAGEYQGEADINRDGVVDLIDIAPFVKLLK